MALARRVLLAGRNYFLAISVIDLLCVQLTLGG